jgi:hypothetical protein
MRSSCSLLPPRRRSDPSPSLPHLLLLLFSARFGSLLRGSCGARSIRLFKVFTRKALMRRIKSQELDKKHCEILIKKIRLGTPLVLQHCFHLLMGHSCVPVCPSVIQHLEIGCDESGWLPFVLALCSTECLGES